MLLPEFIGLVSEVIIFSYKNFLILGDVGIAILAIGLLGILIVNLRTTFPCVFNWKVLCVKLEENNLLLDRPVGFY